MEKSGPPVLRFTSRLVKQPKTAKSDSQAIFNVPYAVSKKLSGMASVEGTVNGHPFRASLETADSGIYSVRANQAMLRGARAKVGDTVNLAILGPEPKLVLPADLRVALNASQEAKALWNDLSDLGRRDYIRWIDGTNAPETRARRVRRTVEQLAEGKRRPCCVNVYEYMLRHIE